MTLIYGYNVKTFWNNYEYTEFRNTMAGEEELKKAFNALKKDRTGAIKFVIDNISYVVMYDSMSDFERGILTVNIEKNYNSRDSLQAAYSVMRRACIKLFNGVTDTLKF